ncbi:WD40/YVTN repeat-like-containing domain [Plasmopara halstedii]|uniref:WD40/YVTN repeat-like-containing domain n=1 Tax=Plasmopara halstedii TaxID=4781 RepID=A0A0P1A7C9_PLAHL|nr:WD40/YVTN repeat-like-containing domain [Plasmopara halstedii]CEG36514.1 WD40/YVTN repeat-like-containing domain [Plasmopara halstedii]|eukprot:XP_024572883.1 WD40/YVTN repeat-like-containing domain [Plasmopara halstedii]
MPTLYVGTYTRKEGHVDGHAKGLHAYSFNEITGALKLLNVMEKAGINPSYVCGTNTILYAVNESNELSLTRPGEETGFVSAYKMEKDGKLTQISRHETHGPYTCHVALSPNGDFLSVSNYNGGSLALYPVNADGSLSPASDYHHFQGASMVIPDRQETSHIHSTAWTSNGLVAADLGTDRLVQYKLDVAAKNLIDEEFISCPPGSGPRHFALSMMLGVGYVINELSNTVSVYPLDVKTGKLSHVAIQHISTLPLDYSGPSALASDIHISGNNKFVYAATRFCNSITIYKILPDTRLELVEILHTRGFQQHRCLPCR